MATQSIVIKTRLELANAARAYQWDKVLQILHQHPHLVDSTRPGGKSLYTSLHQAAHGSAPAAVVKELLALGASTTIQTAGGERAFDIARAKAYHLIGLLQPVAEASLTRFPPDVDAAQGICALRFQGYEYIQWIGKEWSAVIDPIVKERVLHDEQGHNFAAFFGLQRHLYKWGGEYLTKYAEEHMAFDFLFLHLYRLEPEERFRHPEYCGQWQQKCAPWAESIAGYVRKSMRRIGHGESVNAPPLVAI